MARPDQTLHEALTQLRAREVGRIPVVAPDHPKRLPGFLRRHDILRAYTQKGG